jgi:hypothetical protein
MNILKSLEMTREKDQREKEIGMTSCRKEKKRSERDRHRLGKTSAKQCGCCVLRLVEKEIDAEAMLVLTDAGVPMLIPTVVTVGRVVPMFLKEIEKIQK